MKYISALLLCVVATTAYAEHHPQADSVEGWLQLQREGTKASTLIQSATTAERERSAARWLKSFEHEIPATSEDASVGSD